MHAIGNLDSVLVFQRSDMIHKAYNQACVGGERYCKSKVDDHQYLSRCNTAMQ